MEQQIYRAMVRELVRAVRQWDSEKLWGNEAEGRWDSKEIRQSGREVVEQSGSEAVGLKHEAVRAVIKNSGAVKLWSSEAAWDSEAMGQLCSVESGRDQRHGKVVRQWGSGAVRY